MNTKTPLKTLIGLLFIAFAPIAAASPPPLNLQEDHIDVYKNGKRYDEWHLFDVKKDPWWFSRLFGAKKERIDLGHIIYSLGLGGTSLVVITEDLKVYAPGPNKALGQLDGKVIKHFDFKTADNSFCNVVLTEKGTLYVVSTRSLKELSEIEGKMSKCYRHAQSHYLLVKKDGSEKQTVYEVTPSYVKDVQSIQGEILKEFKIDDLRFVETKDGYYEITARFKRMPIDGKIKYTFELERKKIIVTTTGDVHKLNPRFDKIGHIDGKIMFTRTDNPPFSSKTRAFLYAQTDKNSDTLIVYKLTTKGLEQCGVVEGKVVKEFSACGFDVYVTDKGKVYTFEPFCDLGSITGKVEALDFEVTGEPVLVTSTNDVYCISNGKVQHLGQVEGDNPTFSERNDILYISTDKGTWEVTKHWRREEREYYFRLKKTL